MKRIGKEAASDLSVDEQLAFDEEAGCLSTIESELDGLIAPCEAKIRKLETELRNWRSYDYDDADRKKAATRDLERNRAKKNRIEGYKPSPYFCHLELIVDGGEPRNFFLGDQEGDVRSGTKDLILGRWSPLRSIVYAKAQKQFVLTNAKGEPHTYDLMLRRRVVINNEELTYVDTQYDSADTTLDGELVDPFLRAVLRDKRRNYKLSNIIRTIQANQNEILERPLDESFIVQGCAGSGKTMILLHRLSYIASRYPGTDFSKYVILTPNESFNRHIDELCDDLNLGRITRMTLESYYLQLIHRMARNDVYIDERRSGASRQREKLAFNPDTVQSDAVLPHDYLSRVYSMDFLVLLGETIAHDVRQALTGLNSPDIRALLDEWNMGIPGSAGTPYAVYQAVARAFSRIDRESQAAQETVESQTAKVAETSQEIRTIEQALDSAVLVLNPAKEEVMRQCFPRYAALIANSKTAKQDLSNARARLKRAEGQLNDANERVQKAQTAYEEADKQAKRAHEFAGEEFDRAVLREDPSLQEQSRMICMNEYEAIANLQDELDNVGLLGFGRRRRLRTDLEAARSEYQAKYNAVLDAEIDKWVEREVLSRREQASQADAALVELRDQLSAYGEDFSRAQAHLNEVSEEYAAKAQSFDQLEKETAALGPFIAAFEGGEYPDISELPAAHVAEATNPELSSYAQVFAGLSPTQKRSLATGKRRIATLKRVLESAEEELAAARERALSVEEKDALQKLEEVRDALDIRRFDKRVSELLGRVADECGIGIADNATYRYDLYVKALLCACYYGPLDGRSWRICIDEAQDLSFAEHELLRRALGNEAVFNLYGDLNQLVYSYKGIDDWYEIALREPCGYYELNENYRNTVQITSYCNEHFGMNAMAIGLDGDDVSRLLLRPAIDELFALRGADERMRCALLYKRGLGGLHEALDELLGVDAAWDEVDASKVSVVAIEDAKGLEFDAVVVIENSMTRNELYVAMTRALDYLVITELPNAVIDLGSHSFAKVTEDLDDKGQVAARSAAPGAESSKLGAVADGAVILDGAASGEHAADDMGQNEEGDAFDPFFDFDFE